MKIKKHVRTVPFVALSLFVLGTAAAFAQRNLMVLRAGRPEIKIALSGAVERKTGLIPVQEAETVKSGEVMDWTITSSNEGTASAHEYKAVGVVPPGTEFIAGSATVDGNATVTYSIDHGKSFYQRPTVDEKQADGTFKKVPAPTSMYTQIRYEWADPLEQGAKRNATYKVRMF